MPELRLAGCRSRPLLGYLKALGVHRIVARQADGDARGRWVAGTFELASVLNREELEEFLLERYIPSPVVSPWNGGSGFFPNDRSDALEAIERSEDSRLGPYRQAISTAREVLAELGVGDKPAGESKLSVVRALRRRLPDDALDWLDAAIVLTGLDVAYPPLLGSGGNDGRFDFSNNFAQTVVKVRTGNASPVWLRGALHSQPVPLQPKLSLAHFFRDASPVNSPKGESDSLGNPWDLALAVEGALVLTAGVARRHGSSRDAALVAPFTARATAAGYGSAVGRESGRAELWLPLWTGWSTFREIEALVREARAQVGRRRARNGLDFVRAAGELGVARGIEAFERYAILERAGQASLAVPAGRVEVAPRASTKALRSLDDWLDRILGYARRDRCPRSAVLAIRALERTVFELAERSEPTRACETLERLGDVEATLAAGADRASEAGLKPFRAVPAGPWLELADDSSAEFAVAMALSSVRDRRAGLPALRDYLHGTHRDVRGWRSFEPDEFTRIPRHARAVARLAAIHARRHLDAAAVRGSEASPRSLNFDLGAPCHRAAARLFALGRLDDDRIVRLVRGLALLDFGDSGRWRASFSGGGDPTPTFDLLTLACYGLAETPLGPRPGWTSKLVAGAVRPVLDDALLRVRLAHIHPLVSADDLEAAKPDGERLAAALVLKPSDRALNAIADRLTLRLEATESTTTESEAIR